MADILTLEQLRALLDEYIALEGALTDHENRGPVFDAEVFAWWIPRVDILYTREFLIAMIKLVVLGIASYFRHIGHYSTAGAIKKTNSLLMWHFASKMFWLPQGTDLSPSGMAKAKASACVIAMRKPPRA